jgi:TetR/AcrR family transcriptional regulator, regulator of cefoperazone and chloramphenicol sensitivity
VRSIELEQDDLTAKARLRETALALFADHGIAATSLRSIAAAAGVSPGLVIHHFGTKDGLRRAVDAVVVKRIAAALSEVPITSSSGASLIDQRAEVLARVLRPQPALLQYVAQALSESGPAAGELFALLYAAASADQALADAGAIRADSDPVWRALQQLVLIVGPLLLRPLVEQQLGGPLFEPGNFERWMRANADLLKHGLYTPPAPSTPAQTASPPEPSHAENPERRPRER